MATLHTVTTRSSLLHRRPAFMPLRPSACKTATANTCKRARVPLTITNILSNTSTNPAFTYGKVNDAIQETGRGSAPMTVDGAVQKTSLLLAVTMVGAAYTWMQIFSGNAAAAAAALGTSKIAGIVAAVSAIATMFKPHWSPATSLIFSAGKGLALGGLSAVLEVAYPGIVMNSMTLTFGVAATLLVGFQANIIKVTDKFRDGVMMITGGYFAAMLLTWLMSLFGLKLTSLLSTGPIGMGVGLVAAGLASANLLLDFDMIRMAARQRMPKWFEWYAGFSLMVTLVWMYTEILRLLSMFASGGRSDD